MVGKLITTDISKNLFFHEENLQTENASKDTEVAIINIFDEIEYQEILGFGGAFTESSAYNYSLLNDENKKCFMEKYFDRENGIAYNFGRTHINSCDFSLDIYSYVKEGDKTLETFDISRDKKYIIPFIKDALQYCNDELVLFASPWSPPEYMKDNQSVIGGGKLLEDYKKVWALYYAKYIKAFADNGIKIFALSVQNEPMARQTWESCNYTAEDEKEFLEKYLIPALDKENLSDIKIILWDHNKERVYDRTEKILKDNKALSNRIWAVGHHWYTGDHFEGLRLVHEQFDKPLICTEFCCSLADDMLSAAERYAKEICGNFNNFEIASCDWNLLLNDKGGPFHNRSKTTVAVPGVVFDDVSGGCLAPVLRNSETNELIFTPIYYYIGHFSKYLKRGAKRIAITRYTDALDVCAFRNPNGDIVCVILNSSNLNLPVNIRIKDTVTEIQINAHTIKTFLLTESITGESYEA